MGERLVHPKAMSSVIFTLDTIFSILSNIIGLFETTRASAIAIILLFSVAGVLVIVPFSILVFKFSDHSVVGVIAWIIQVLLAVGYYYGKYIYGIMIRYGTFLGCNEDCLRANQFIALFSLMLAILLLQFVIPMLHGIIRKKSKKRHPIFAHYFFGVIALCVNANAIFATLSIIPAEIQCTSYAVVFSSVFLAIITVVTAIKIYTDYLEKEKEVKERKKEEEEEKEKELKEIKEDEDEEKIDISKYPPCQRIFAIVFGYYLLMFLVPFFLIGNNQLPLGYINCNSSGEGFVETGKIADHIVRLVFMLITVAAVSFALYTLWMSRKKNWNKQILNVLRTYVYRKAK